MFKRCLARPKFCFRPPLSYRVAFVRFESNIPESVPKRTESDSHSKSDENKQKPESWSRWIATRAGAIAVGYVVGKVYHYYYPKPDDSFVPYELVSREPVSSTLSVFIVRPKTNDAPANIDELRQAWRQGIWNLQFKQPQLQITRAYTPVPLGHVQDTNELQFLIRRDPRGEVSGYLHRLPTGSEIEMRGPNIEYPISPQTQNVIFIAGGTGIAPALQVAHAMFAEPDPAEASGKKLHILWANRQKEDISHSNTTTNPIVQHLDALSRTYGPNIQVSIFADDEQQYITPAVVSTALDCATVPSHPGTKPTANIDPEIQGTHVIVSGSEGFISHLAGPKIWKDGGEQQGAVGGILGKILADRRDSGRVKVWKV